VAEDGTEDVGELGYDVDARPIAELAVGDDDKPGISGGNDGCL
jgi:hypothetical protein